MVERRFKSEWVKAGLPLDEQGKPATPPPADSDEEEGGSDSGTEIDAKGILTSNDPLLERNRATLVLLFASNLAPGLRLKCATLDL